MYSTVATLSACQQQEQERCFDHLQYGRDKDWLTGSGLGRAANDKQNQVFQTLFVVHVVVGVAGRRDAFSCMSCMSRDAVSAAAGIRASCLGRLINVVTDVA